MFVLSKRLEISCVSCVSEKISTMSLNVLICQDTVVYKHMVSNVNNCHFVSVFISIYFYALIPDFSQHGDKIRYQSLNGKFDQINWSKRLDEHTMRLQWWPELLNGSKYSIIFHDSDFLFWIAGTYFVFHKHDHLIFLCVPCNGEKPLK